MPQDIHGAKNKYKRAKKQDTQSRESAKHVSLQRSRPKLSSQSSRNQHAQSRYQKALSPKKGEKATSETNIRKKNIKKEPGALLRIIPLGGLDAIGKNMTCIECGNDMIIDDAGLMFPDDSHPGIDLILPDYTYVLENAEKLRGIIITHGHEDHTGSLPYLLKDLDLSVPIYATRLTLGLIEGKLIEHKIKNAKLCEIKPGQSLQLGCMSCEFFSVNHSIPDAVGVFFRSPAGNVLHTGDFKLDQTPIDGVRTDFAALLRFAQEGVDLFISDSTNALNPGFTLSEAEVGRVLDQIISNAHNRVIVAAFASHIHRMQQICDAAVRNGRKVAVTGRSMVQNTDIARRLGYLNIADKDIIDAYDLRGCPSNSYVVMCTGSQGEPLSALARIAGGSHKTISIEEGDTVIISATPVPGNEKAVTKVTNDLAKIGADVFDKSRARVHVSGHASSEELKLVLSMVQPKAFMPVHGEATHLRAHACLALACGVKRENIFICENGESLELTVQGVRRGTTVPNGIILVDGLSVGDTTEQILRERASLGSQGVAVVACALGNKNKQPYMLGDVKVEMHGIPGGDEKEFVRAIRDSVRKSLTCSLSKNEDVSSIKKTLRQTMLSILWERTKQRPLLVINILEC